MINSPLNYSGNKFKVLEQIIPILDTEEDTICDIFCGSGLVALNSNYNNIVLNDSFKQILDLIRFFQKEKPENIISEVDKVIKKYGFTDTYRNGKDKYPEKKHEGLSRFNKKPFQSFKERYIEKNSVLDLFVLTIFSFNHYIRYNNKGVYNVPVGKVDYSASLRKKTIEYSNILKKRKIKISNKDFRDKTLYKKKALYYFDPPYLITSAPYNKDWDIKKEKDLLSILDRLDSEGKKFALSNVLRSNGKENKLLVEWSKKYYIYNIKRRYRNSNYQKKNLSEAEEVLITNYK